MFFHFLIFEPKNSLRLLPLPILRGGHPGPKLEEAAERGLLIESQHIADLLNGEVLPVGEQRLGLQRQILVDALTCPYAYLRLDDRGKVLG